MPRLLRPSLLAALAAASLAGPAAATPRVFPLSYGTQTNAPGEAELEQAIDLTPVPFFEEPGARAWTLRTKLNTELEIGLTDSLEFALYVAFANNPGEAVGAVPLYFDALRQRLRWRLTEPGQLPVDLGLYLEASESHDALELEARLLIEKRIGRLHLVSNLWVEVERGWGGGGEVVLRPTLGAAWELKPGVTLGLEAFLHTELEEASELVGAVDKLNKGLKVFVGPTFAVQFKKVWLNAGVYARVTDVARYAEVGDEFGKLWVRVMAGIEL